MLNFGLGKTARLLAARVPGLGRYFRLDESMLTQLEEALLLADVGVETTAEILEQLRKSSQRQSADLKSILRQILYNLLSQPVPTIPVVRPRIILVVGVNGTGKTTTIGKLAHRFVSQDQSVLIAAADTFRAAAYEQLKILAERSGAEFMGNPQGSDPSAIAFDAVKSALARRSDILIIDTAGRLHTKSNLMEELTKVKRVIGKVMPGAPHDTWMVLDATIGQNSLEQVRIFQNSLAISGIILTKLDGTAKGGIVFAISRQLRLPIRYLGIGEKLTDLVDFDAEKFVSALLGEEPR